MRHLSSYKSLFQCTLWIFIPCVFFNGFQVSLLHSCCPRLRLHFKRHKRVLVIKEFLCIQKLLAFFSQYALLYSSQIELNLSLDNFKAFTQQFYRTFLEDFTYGLWVNRVCLIVSQFVLNAFLCINGISSVQHQGWCSIFVNFSINIKILAKIFGLRKWALVGPKDLIFWAWFHGAR